MSVLALAAAGFLALPAASLGAGFGVEEKGFEAGTCNVQTCEYSSPHGQFYTQASGHPPFGITGFEFKSEEPLPGLKVPIGRVKNVRVDVPPGLAANPEALPHCKVAEFEADTCSASTQIGENQLTVAIPPTDVTIPAAVFNLEQPEGLPLEFGIHVFVPPLINEHIFLVGHVSWNTDYHEYFEIHNVSAAVPLLKSKLIFFGTAGTGFLTLPSECSSTTTSHLRVESYEGEVSETDTHTPVGVSGCSSVPFAPSLGVTPSTTQSDQPDGLGVNVSVPQNPSPSAIDSSTVRTAVVTLPEGLTLNPSSANGLQACTDAQIGIGTTTPVSCPAASQLGTVDIEVPTLPAGSLKGNVYLGAPLSTDPASGQEYRIFVDAESARYGVSTRLEGRVKADPSTGRLTATFADLPQQPFSEFSMHFNGGSKAPLANPLACGTATTATALSPYTGAAAATPASAFAVDSNGKGAACSKPLPFSLAQSTQVSPATAGAYSSYTFSLTRAEGQQYLSQVKVALPKGLLAVIAGVPLCEEPQAAQGSCPAASAIGTTTVTLGSGDPYPLTGTVYLTGPYAGAPYGLSIAVPAEKVGPFNYGTIVTREKIEVDKHTADVTVTAPSLPTVVGGVPVRLRSVTVSVNRGSYLFNPTNCSAFATDSTLNGFTPATAESAVLTLSTPFQVTGCSSLPFKPTFSSSVSAHSSRTNGVSFSTKITAPAHEANIASLLVTLPKILPSRLTTLQQACRSTTFEANPASCPAGSLVGSASVTTPVLPGKMTGPAYLVSHGNAAFPDLDLILRGANGVEVILVGTTNIVNGITTTNFATLPDVPVSSVEVNLPAGSHSALTAEGNLCAGRLLMPTKITAQNGAVINQNTVIHPTGCSAAQRAPRFGLVRYRVHGHSVTLTLKVPQAGRLTVRGHDLTTGHVRFKNAATKTLTLKLTRAGVRALARHHRLSIRLSLALAPSHGKALAAHGTIVFGHSKAAPKHHH
ncbi:MAG: hypothetical protein FWD42_01620 [Solirubrobacterales bacterium]|nr:hypothetical protein [Solirubrobacterales bacterium]